MPLTWVNPAFTATTGYPYEEAVGRNCRFLQGEGTDAVQVAALHAALQTGRDGRVVLLNYRKDGTAFWNEVAVSPVRDAAGALTHFLGVQTDVTARVEADRSREQALRAERTARAEAEQTREKAQVVSRRMSVVAEATGLLAATLDVAQSLDRLARLVVPLLADWVVIHLTDEHGRLGGPTFLRHRDGRPDLLDRYRELVAYDVAVGTVLRDLLAGGPPMLLGQYVAPSVSELGEREREMLWISLELGATSLVCVPLTARRTVMGTMMLVQGSSGRAFDTGDLDLVADLGRRAGLAVDNARLYTQARTTALALQRSLLPVLPEVPGLTLAADYLPAHQDSQVGGDWWDVFALPDGATGLAVATSWGTTSPLQPRWVSCGASCVPAPGQGTGPLRCSPGWTGSSRGSRWPSSPPASTPASSRPTARTDAGGSPGCAGRTPGTCRRSCWDRTGRPGCCKAVAVCPSVCPPERPARRATSRSLPDRHFCCTPTGSSRRGPATSTATSSACSPTWRATAPRMVHRRWSTGSSSGPVTTATTSRCSRCMSSKRCC